MPQDYIFAAPYPEGAVMKLSQHVSETSNLRSLYVPSRRALRLLASLMRGEEQLNVGARLRRGAHHIPETIEVAPWLEPLRLITKTRMWPKRLEVMDVIKQRFDKTVSTRVSKDDGVFLGMPGACFQSFESAPQLLKVFHEVDAHPRARNAILEGHYGRHAASESVSSSVVHRIEAELALADLVLSPSTIVTKQLTDHGVEGRRIAQIPYGVDTHRFQPLRPQSRRSRPHFLYVGQISYRKGIPFLLEAARGQDFTVQLIGPLVAPELVRSLPSNVEYSPPVAHEYLATHLANADAFVFPSVEDNFALVILEALAAGVPVISTDAVGSSSMVGPHDGTIVPAGNSDSLREAMQATDFLSWERRLQVSQETRSPERPGGRINTWNDYSTAIVNKIERARARK